MHLNLANVWAAQAREDEVLGVLDAMLEKWPQHRDTLYNRGTAAELRCWQALDVDSNFADAPLNLAGVRAEQGEYQEALSHYQRIIAWSLQDAEAHTSCGMLCLGLGRFE